MEFFLIKIFALLDKTCKMYMTKCENQHHVYCDYNDTSIIYINFNMAYNRVFGNKARLEQHPYTHKISWF